MQTAAKHVVTAYQDAPQVSFLGDLARIVGAGSSTNGAFSLVHLSLAPGHATPLHVHHAHDEAFFVLDGEIRGICGDDLWRASGGSFIWLPRGIQHAFQAFGERAVELLVMSIPGGFDEFVMATSTPVDEPESAVDPVALAEIASQHGIEILGPPVNLLD